MRGTKGVDKILAEIKGLAERTANPRPGLGAVGRMARKRHVGYFDTSGEQTMPGGGPPGAPWRGISEARAKFKEKQGKTKKLVFKGTLKNRYMHRVAESSVMIYNADEQKAEELQHDLGFTVVATDPVNDDPELVAQSEQIMLNWVWDGKK